MLVRLRIMKQCSVGQVDDRHSFRRSRCPVTGGEFGSLTSEAIRGERKRHGYNRGSRQGALQGEGAGRGGKGQGVQWDSWGLRD